MCKGDSKIRDNINMESVEKALNSLKDLFKEILEKNEALTKEVEKLRAAEEQRKDDKIKELENNIQRQQIIANTYEELRKNSYHLPPPAYWFQNYPFKSY